MQIQNSQFRQVLYSIFIVVEFYHATVLHRKIKADYPQGHVEDMCWPYRVFKLVVISSNQTEKANICNSNLQNKFECICGVVCIIHSVINTNLLKPTGYVMHQQFNIQQLYVLPTLYLCVLYLSENKQRLVPLTA